MGRFRLINYYARYTAVGWASASHFPFNGSRFVWEGYKAISGYQLTGARFVYKTAERGGRRRSGAKKRGTAENEVGHCSQYAAGSA